MPTFLSNTRFPLADATLGFRHGSPSTPLWKTGTGTPEGAIAAPIGSLYSRLDGGTDTTLYRKEAGVGNTGWVATTAGGSITSVDGRTGVVTLSDLYVDIAGDTMTGNLRAPSISVGTAPAGSGDVRLSSGSAIDAPVGGNYDLSVGNNSLINLHATVGVRLYAPLSMTGGNNFDLGKNQILNPVHHKLASAPASPVEGQWYYDTSLKAERFYNGTAWVSLGGSAGVSSVDGRAGAVTLSDLYVDVTGDTMTGDLRVATRINAGGNSVPVDTILSAGEYQTNFVNVPYAYTGMGSYPGNSNMGGGVVGILAEPSQTGSGGTLSGQFVGVQSRLYFYNPTGTATNAVSFRAKTPQVDAGTVTNAYGLEIEAQKSVRITTAYGIYQRGVSDLNCFMGNIGLGISSPTSRVQLAPGTTVAEGIKFGTDVNLYRSASSTLSSDGLLTAGSGFRQGTTGPLWLSGTGTPEGVATATVGSIYSRTDGGTDTAFYKKESGTGATGWVAVAAIAAGSSGVTSVDGRTGVVTLTDRYVDVSGDTMTGQLNAPAVAVSIVPIDPSSTVVGVSAVMSPNYTANSSIASTGGNFVQNVYANPARTLSGTFNGIAASVANTGPGPISGHLKGVVVSTGNTGTGTVNVANALEILPTTGTGPMNYVTGLQVGNQGRTGSLTYGISIEPQAGSSSTSLRVGTGVTRTLWLSHDADGTTPAQGIIFGNSSDVNLYRSSSGVLSIDGSLAVSTRVTAASGFRLGDTSRPTWTAGNGAPEGTVSAPAGSIYSRLDGSADSAFYRKESSGTTGWVAVTGGGAGGGGVTSVDGRTGVVTLSDKYIDVGGDAMTGNLDLSKNQLLNPVSHKLASAPGSPVEGQWYYDTALKAERFWNGSTWVAKGGSTGGVASVDGRTGAVTLTDLYVDVAGDTMTGDLRVPKVNAGGNGVPVDAMISAGEYQSNVVNVPYIWTGVGSYPCISNMGGGGVVGVNTESSLIKSSGGGTLAGQFVGVQSRLYIYVPTGGATNAINFRAKSPVSDGGTITNAFGLDIEAQKGTNITNGYGVYQRGTTDLNLFAGPIALLNAATGPQLRAGTGAPEGVTSAPVGSLYLRADGSTDATVYRKEAGSTGPNGWVATGSGGGGGVTSVDGRTGVVTLDDKYVDVTGDNMSGTLNISKSGSDAPSHQAFIVNAVNNASVDLGGFSLTLGAELRAEKTGAGNWPSSVLIGAQVTAYNDGAGTLGFLRAIQIYHGGMPSHGNITSSQGINIGGPQGTGTIGTTLGLGVGNQGRAGVGDAVGIQVDAMTGSSSTNVGVKIAESSTAALWLGYGTNATTLAGGIAFGASRDTDWYRSAAGKLRTSGTITAAGDAYIDGFITAGAAFDPNLRLQVRNTTTHTTSLTGLGGRISTVWSGNGALSNVYLCGLDAMAEATLAAGGTYTNALDTAIVAHFGTSRIAGDGTYNTWANGVAGRVTKGGAGNLANAVAINANNPAVTGAGLITNAYGLSIGTQKVTGVTNGYGVYQWGANDTNVFAGNVQCSNGITFAPDAVGIKIVWHSGGHITGIAPSTLYHDVAVTSLHEFRVGGTARARVNATGLDLAQNQLQNAVTHKLATPPASPVEGQRYYDTVTKLERYWDGTKWSDQTDVWVGTAAPTGTPAVGDLWYDTDDVSTLVLPMSVANGGTGSATAAGARTNLLMPGEELAYNQITARASVTATSAAGAQLIIDSGARVYDGSPILVTFYASNIQSPIAAGALLHLSLWDGSTDLGFIGNLNTVAAAVEVVPCMVCRRITPTAGTHTYRLMAFVSAGTGTIEAGAGGVAASPPTYLRITRA
jgi:hypothetical protein